MNYGKYDPLTRRNEPLTDKFDLKSHNLSVTLAKLQIRSI